MKLLLLVCCAAFWSFVCGIQCNVGAQFTSPLVSLDNLNVTECPPEDTYCIRGEGFVETALQFNVSVQAIGFCANQTICDDECSSLGDRVIQEFILGSSIPISELDPSMLSRIYNITICNSACCDTDLCNQYTVNEIMMRNRTDSDSSSTNTADSSTPTITSTTATTVAQTTTGAESVVVYRGVVAFMSLLAIFTALVYN